MTRLRVAARDELRESGVTRAAFARSLGWLDGQWYGDSCGCPDARCIGHHHDEDEPCGCLSSLLREHLRGER